MLDNIIKNMWKSIYKTTLSCKKCNVNLMDKNVVVIKPSTKRENITLMPIRII